MTLGPAHRPRFCQIERPGSAEPEELEELPGGAGRAPAALPLLLLFVPARDALVPLVVRLLGARVELADLGDGVLAVERVLAVGRLNELQVPELAVFAEGGVERKDAAAE